MTSFQWPNMWRAITKIQQKNLFFKISPSDLLNILYQLTKFEVAYKLYYKFSMPKFAKSNNSKKIKTFLKFSPGNLLIIFYHLTTFEAASYNNFQDIFIYEFSMPKFATGNN